MQKYTIFLNETYKRAVVALWIMVTLVPVSALGFEYVGGYLPCKLCLEQRTPWYIAVAIVTFALITFKLNVSPFVPKILILIVSFLMAYSLYLGIYHAGIEWSWWMGSSDCVQTSMKLVNEVDIFLKQLEETKPPSCGMATLRILGLSFAGWNAFVSLILLFYTIILIMLPVRSKDTI